MNGVQYFFIIFYALVAVIGLVTVGLAHDYLQFFGFAMLLFGMVSAFVTMKRHFDEREKY